MKEKKIGEMSKAEFMEFLRDAIKEAVKEEIEKWENLELEDTNVFDLTLSEREEYEKEHDCCIVEDDESNFGMFISSVYDGDTEEKVPGVHIQIVSFDEHFDVGDTVANLLWEDKDEIAKVAKYLAKKASE